MNQNGVTNYSVKLTGKYVVNIADMNPPGNQGIK